ncbi:Hypothetical protein NTJ_00378 [Nesidiocoris tenuis]|uniref:SEFIR domain-containing protein n=1 Tax=Nesidiocoris tenuis TaxID=355587 RepID=A0ABN7A8K7_9HEMI|nr:Hypothetical protein NTJ_00378 [Nesidiocoris tenuis]
MFVSIKSSILLCPWFVILLFCASKSLEVYARLELPKACENCDSEHYLHDLETMYVSRCVDAIPTKALSNESEYNLCSTQLKHQVVDPRSGLVAFCILLPHDTENSKILLRSLKPGDEKSEVQGCTPRAASVHSSFKMRPDSKYDPTCRPDQYKEIKWKFNYLFTGWYVVEIELKFNCSSTPFYVESNFIKEPLSGQNLSMATKFIGQHLYANFYFGIQFHHNYPNTAIVKLRSNNSYLDKRLACCITGFLTRHCYWFKEDSVLSLQCSCQWNDDYLECVFAEIPPGIYCVELEVYDSRCKRDTLWTENSSNPADPCLWKFENLSVKNNSASLDPYQKITTTSHVSWIVLLFIAASVLGITVSLYLRLRNVGKKNQFLPVASQPADNVVSISLNSSEKTAANRKVFLLYARDSQPFMKAMTELRNLLSRSTGAQVLDLWDRGMKDKIDTTGDTWALRYLLDEDVQAVVVASPGSVRVEQAILNDENVTYDVPDSRDETFTSAFKTVIRMTHTQKDRCWKIIVVRIDSKGCSNVVLKTFEETLATVYTLPQHIDNLLSHIRQDPNSESAASLQSRVAFQKTVEDFQDSLASSKDFSSD